MNPAEFNTRLLSLPFEGMLVFALSCGERLFPNYKKFARDYRWGDEAALRTALDYGWDSLLRRPFRGSIDELLSRCDDALPDVDDFQTPMVSPALDAASVALMLLQIIKGRDQRLVVQISELARDTVDMYVQLILDLSPTDPQLAAKVACHPLMQREVDHQKADLLRAETISSDRSFREALERELRDPPRSNIDQV